MGLQTKKYKAQFAYTERKKLFKGNDSCFMSVVYHLSLSLCTHTQYRMIKKVMLPNANNFVSKNYHHLQWCHMHLLFSAYLMQQGKEAWIISFLNTDLSILSQIL
jgi:hypothetical protein